MCSKEIVCAVREELARNEREAHLTSLIRQIHYDMQKTDTSKDLRHSREVCKGFRTNPKCQYTEEEIGPLRQQVKDLNEAIVSLENTLHLKDAQLENAHRDNERLSAELKKQQRCNRNIKQQLNDERFFYQREKDYFDEELQRLKARCISNASKVQQQEIKELQRSRDSLEEENKSLKGHLFEKNETTYNLCIKFLRMKHAKDGLRQKLDRLLREHLQVMAETMERLDEARKELNFIVSEKFQDPLPVSKAKVLQVVQKNARLVHENASMKVQIQHLSLSMEKLKCLVQKPKTINVDAKIITKLAEKSRCENKREPTKWPPIHSSTEGTEKAVKKSQNTGEPVDHSGDAKFLLQIQCKRSSKRIESGELQTENSNSKELPVECRCNSPEMTRKEIQGTFSTIDQLILSIDHRDASTNT